MSDVKKSDLEIIEPVAQADNETSSSLEVGSPKVGPTFIDVLMNPKAIKALEGLIVTVVEHTRKSHASERMFMGISLLAIIGAIVGLSVFDKLNPSAGVILGSLAGYLFGKRAE